MLELPRQSCVHVLWARCDRYPGPQFITAWPDDLVDAWHDWYLELRDKAIRDFIDFDDWPEADWVFWVEIAEIDKPAETGETIEIPPKVAVDA